MVIGIYGRSLANRAGIGRYTRELLRAMLTLPTQHRFRVFVGAEVAQSHEELLGSSAVRLEGSTDRIREEQFSLPRAMRKESLDLFHSPDFTLPLSAPRSIPSLVTVYDVSYLRLPGSSSLKSRLLYTTIVPASIRRARLVLAISEFTKQEVMEVYRLPEERVVVVSTGIEDRLAPATADEVAAVRKRFSLPESGVVLYLGGIEPRKNLVRLAEAVSGIPGARLAIAGGKNQAASEILDQASMLLGERLITLGFVPDADLPALYGAADVFAYPSLYEGFGIPPVEALACGTAVACSNAASLPEAVGDAAEMFDPQSVSEMRSSIARLLSDSDLRAVRRDAGFEQAAKFKWSDVAARTLAAYEHAAGAN